MSSPRVRKQQRESRSSEDPRKSFNPIHLKFEHLVVTSGEAQLLNDVSGEVKPGEFLAIMGPSGAGKSTLLNTIAGRAVGTKLESGQVLINEQPADDDLRLDVGYVSQFDMFFSHLTVGQTLKFVGDVRISDELKQSEKYKIVNEVINAIGLRKCVDTVIGGDFFVPGCSGGEKKRCSVAVELITNPPLLMLDEPTSGLDSSTARTLIDLVRKLAHEGNRTVLTTIHQPSSQVFEMFDKLMLLCNGKVAYFGKTKGVVPFFEHIGLPCYPDWNVADYIMEQLTAGEDIQKRITDGYIEFISDPATRGHCFDDAKLPSSETEFAEGDFSDENEAVGFNDEYDAPDGRDLLIRQDTHVKYSSEMVKKRLKYPTGFFTQAIALSKRSFIQMKKDVWDVQSTIQTAFAAIFSGLLWLNTPYSEERLSDRNGLIFYALFYLVMTPMFNALMTFPVERSTVSKERSDGMYRLSAYYISKCLSELPVLLLQPVLFYAVIYWMGGLNRSVWFLVGVLNVITFSFIAQTYGLCIGACIKNFKNALTFCLILSDVVVLTSGFFTANIPFWLKWIKYTSHITYSYNIFILMEYQHAVKTFSCAKFNSVYDVCKLNSTNFITGPEIAAKTAPIHLGMGESFAVLWGLALLFRILLYIILRFFNNP